jgi:hypothetical protein
MKMKIKFFYRDNFMLPQRDEGGECFFGEGEVELYVYCCLL